MSIKKLKVGDRVKRISGSSCLGVVKELCMETTISSSSIDQKERPAMISVLWDNGTLSCFGPEALEMAKE